MKKIILFVILLLLLLFLVSFRVKSPVNIDKPDNQSGAVKTYLYVWNGGSLDSLDAITSENFQLRMNPDFKPITGRDKLKQNILQTRAYCPDFKVDKKEMIILGDTAMAVTWIISGTYANPADTLSKKIKTESPGFNIIFFNRGIITGEWIGYSDLTWHKKIMKDEK